MLVLSSQRETPWSGVARCRLGQEPRESAISARQPRRAALKAVRIQGVIPPGVSLDAALRHLKDEAELQGSDPNLWMERKC